MRLDVVACGALAWDHVYRVAELPPPGGGTHILEHATAGGGVEGNVAVGLARLGLRVGLIARVGGDDRGAVEELAAEGVDTVRVARLPGATTDFCVILVDPGGERMLACRPGALTRLELDEADLAYAAGARCVFFSAYLPRRQQLRLTAAGEGAALACDLPDSFSDLEGRGFGRPDLERLLASLSLLMLNRRGLADLGGRAGLADLMAGRPELRVAVTLGREGSILGWRGRLVEQPAYGVEAVDTTGAGDAYHAALIQGWLLEGWPMERAARWASAAGALNCRALGARTAMPRLDDLSSFLDGQP